jgi:hypothetical protein
MPNAAFRDFVPEIRLIASEAYQRASHFVERDPLLVGRDREFLNAMLSKRVRELIEAGEQDVIRLANGAISRARQLTQRDARLRQAA